MIPGNIAVGQKEPLALVYYKLVPLTGDRVYSVSKCSSTLLYRLYHKRYIPLCCI